MNEIKRPRPFDVEEIFNQFVIEFGGHLVTEFIDKNHDKPNADYYFKQDSVVAELKCLQKDNLKELEDIPRLYDLIMKWAEKKWIKRQDIFKTFVGAKKIPHRCYSDILNIASKAIDRVIQKASKQIAETKRNLNIPEAKGLLLICADGNYLLNHQGFLSVIGNLLLKKYRESEIDGFVYFTVNQNSYQMENDLDWLVWVPGYKIENDEAFGNFVNRLGDDFLNRYYTKLTGQPTLEPIKEDNFELGMARIKEMKFIPKDIIYPKNDGK